MVECGNGFSHSILIFVKKKKIMFLVPQIRKFVFIRDSVPLWRKKCVPFYLYEKQIDTKPKAIKLDLQLKE